MNSKKNKHIWTAILIVASYVLIQLLPALFIALLAAFNTAIDPLAWSVYGTIISFAIGTTLIVFLDHKRNFTTPTDRPKSSIQTILIWSILGLFILLISQNLSFFIEEQVFNINPNSENTQVLLEFISQYPSFFLASAIFGPIMEEYVFRKAIYGSLSSFTGRVGAAVISSLVFAFIHFDGHILVYSMMGLIFCYLYEKTHSIYTPVLAHLLMNALVVVSAFYMT